MIKAEKKKKIKSLEFLKNTSKLNPITSLDMSSVAAQIAPFKGGFKSPSNSIRYKC